MSSPDAPTPSYRVILRRNGRRHELPTSQVTTENLRRMFQVDVSEVWLRNDVTDAALFPGPDGCFNEEDIADYSTLHVEGPDATSTDSPLPRRPSHLHQSSMTTSSISSTPPPYRSECPSRGSSKKAAASFALRIIRARLLTKKNKKKVDFETLSATHFDVTDSTANVACILDCVRKKWGEDYTIVTSDGIELEDSPSTQGTMYNPCMHDACSSALNQS